MHGRRSMRSTILGIGVIFRALSTAIHSTTVDAGLSDGLVAYWPFNGNAKGCAELGQFLQQLLGVLQVGRIKALGEPAVDRCQEIVSGFSLALLLPQATEAQGCP
jgi:hypothetical protein